MNVIISSIEPNFYLEEKILRGHYSEFFLFIIDDLSVFPFWESVFSKSTKMVVSSSAGISVACPFSYCSEVAIRHPIKTNTVRSTVLPYIILSKGIPQTQGQNDPELLTERFVRSDLWIYIKVLLK